jgi:sugar phosphate isomerase/epimerase
MKTIKGPALFLAQFAGDAAPFNSWKSITRWAADCGYVGVQVPSWDGRLFDLEKAAASKDYCDTFKGEAAEAGIAVTELSTHLQGQLVAVHPAYDAAFDGFAAPAVRGNPKARAEWATDQVKKALTASRKARLMALAETGDTGAQAALRLMEQPTQFLSTVQVGITSIGVFPVLE